MQKRWHIRHIDYKLRMHFWCVSYSGESTRRTQNLRSTTLTQLPFSEWNLSQCHNSNFCELWQYGLYLSLCLVHSAYLFMKMLWITAKYFCFVRQVSSFNIWIRPGLIRKYIIIESLMGQINHELANIKYTTSIMPYSFTFAWRLLIYLPSRLKPYSDHETCFG